MIPQAYRFTGPEAQAQFGEDVLVFEIEHRGGVIVRTFSTLGTPELEGREEGSSQPLPILSLHGGMTLVRAEAWTTKAPTLVATWTANGSIRLDGLEGYQPTEVAALVPKLMAVLRRITRGRKPRLTPSQRATAVAASRLLAAGRSWSEIQRVVEQSARDPKVTGPRMVWPRGGAHTIRGWIAKL